MGTQNQIETKNVSEIQQVPPEAQPIVLRLKGFREYLEQCMSPEPWVMVQAPMVVLLADICNALGLTERDKNLVLGLHGYDTLTAIFKVRVKVVPLNERQTKVVDYLHKHERITNGDYQQLCSTVSTETLRLDLVDLVTRGLLEKHGRCRGTYYTTQK